VGASGRRFLNGLMLPKCADRQFLSAIYDN
jgi:hypothetical protein